MSRFNITFQDIYIPTYSRKAVITKWGLVQLLFLMIWFYMYFQTSLFCKGAFTNWPLTWLFILMNWLIMFIQLTFLRTAVITKHVASLSHELIFCRCLQLCTLVDVLAKNTTEPPISKDCDSTSKRKCQLGIQYRGWGWPWEWQAGRVHSCSLCCTRLTSLKRRQAQVSIHTVVGHGEK